MLSEFSIAIKYDQFPNYHKFSIILSVYLNILRFHNNASIVDSETNNTQALKKKSTGFAAQSMDFEAVTAVFYADPHNMLL